MQKRKWRKICLIRGIIAVKQFFGAFSDELGFERETAMKLASSFGGGMGRLREVCGEVSAMFMIAGLKYGYSDQKDDKTKAEHNSRIQELAQKFKEQNGSIICRELLGLENIKESPVPEARTQSYYQNRPCVELVKSAARNMEEYKGED